jgi:hypothetical protein
LRVRVSRGAAIAGGGGALLGILGLLIFRLVFAPPEPPLHYHANFAIYVHGERLDLSGDRFMVDVAVCAGDVRNPPPQARVHLHNNDPDVVHVHHGGATWGHLLANLRIVLGDRILTTPEEDEILQTGEGGTLKFIINGRPDNSVYNLGIRGGDRLLISFGPESEQEVISTQFPLVASNAPQFDHLPDPAGCGGPEHRTFRERLRHAIAG